MILSEEQIKSITTGAVRIEKEGDKFRFFRFTEKQTALYAPEGVRPSESFYQRCKATAGIRMHFQTNSKTLKMAGEVSKCTSRTYYCFDIFVDGKPFAAIDNYTGVSMPVGHPEVELPLGKFSKEVELGEGDKEICIYFPWSVCPRLEELGLDEGAYITPVKREKILLAFGDSITQGYDALRSSMRYAAGLADKLGAEEYNKGIGGEVFFPAMAQEKDDLSPDYITVAYGTNDWSKETEDSFKVRCRGFYKALSSNYPHAQIFAITPVWRSDYQGERAFGPFQNVETFIREAVADLKNVTVISGFGLIPQNKDYYADLRLHPNDQGFQYYADNLFREISKSL